MSEYLGMFLTSCIFRYLNFFGSQVLNSFRNWILSSESVRQFYTLSSYMSGCIFSSELELKEQREKWFFFRCLCIFRKIFTIIFLPLLDNNRLVRAGRGSWAQFCTVAVTSSSGELRALFLAAGKWRGRQSALGLNSPGTSQAGQTGPIYLEKKCCLVLECSLATRLQVWSCWGLIICGLQSLLKNSSALPLTPIQHGNLVEIMLWADAATPPIWSTVFRQNIRKEQDRLLVFSCPPSSAILGCDGLGKAAHIKCTALCYIHGVSIRRVSPASEPDF